MVRSGGKGSSRRGCSVLSGIDVSKVSTAEMKRDILVYARNYPEDFLDIINDPMLKLQAKVNKFFDSGLLTYRKNRKEVWYSTPTNKKRMLVVPFGDEGVSTVASYLQTDDGVEALKVLEKLLD